MNEIGETELTKDLAIILQLHAQRVQTYNRWRAGFRQYLIAEDKTLAYPQYAILVQSVVDIILFLQVFRFNSQHI
jgi:hypothetical protein